MGTLTAGAVPTPPPPEPAPVAWFDFVLQPSRLEEHLNAIAGGAVDAPRPTALELTNLFLEKAVEKGGAALLGAAEAERRHNSHDSSSAMSGQACFKVLPETHLLSQRQLCLLLLAARAAPHAHATSLPEIEEKVAVRFQRPLLVALLMHCKRQLALQCKCDLYRWHLRRSLPGASEKQAATVIAPEMVAAAEDWLRFFLHETKDVALSDGGIPGPRLGEGELQELREDAAQCPPRQRCVLCYDEGEFSFARGDFARAEQYFKRASWLMTEHASECDGALPLDRLQGFLTACAMMSATEPAQGPRELSGGEPLVLACERARRARDEAALLECVREDRVRGELPAGYRRALEEDGALSLATRARVAAANVAMEVAGGCPPEVALRLIPYVRARDGVREACSRMAYFVDAASSFLGSDGEAGQERITKCVELMSSDFPQAAAHQFASIQGLMLEAPNNDGQEQSVQTHLSKSELNLEDSEELVGAICTQGSPDYQLALWLSQQETVLAPSAYKPLPLSMESGNSGATVPKRKRLEDQHIDSDAPQRKRLAVGESGSLSSANSSSRCTLPAPSGSPRAATVASAMRVLRLTLLNEQGSMPGHTRPGAHLLARVLGRALGWPGPAAEALQSLANQIQTRDPPLPATHSGMVQVAMHVALCASACSAFYAPDGACTYGAHLPAAAPPECEALFHLLFPEATTKPKPRVENATLPSSDPGASSRHAEPKEAIANLDMGPSCAAQPEQAAKEPSPDLCMAMELLTKHIHSPRVLSVVAACIVGGNARAGAAPGLRLEPYGALAFVVAGRGAPPSWRGAPLKSPPSSPRCNLGAKGAGEAVVPDVTEPAGEGGDAASATLARSALACHGLVQTVLLQLVREQGHNPTPESLLALAELAHVEGVGGGGAVCWVRALRYTLQAAAASSRFFAAQEACLPEALFPASVIRQMMAAASALHLALPAVVLSQFLPTPDYAAAFAILKAAPTGQLDASYFEFLWQMPLLELLTHLFSVTNNKAQVATLLALVQRPALCVHNPPNVQNSAITALKQRFLQQLSSQVLGCM